MDKADVQHLEDVGYLFLSKNFKMKCKFNKGLQPLVKKHKVEFLPSATWEGAIKFLKSFFKRILPESPNQYKNPYLYKKAHGSFYRHNNTNLQVALPFPMYGA